MGLGPPVQDPSPGPAGLLRHQRHLKPLLAKAPPFACHRSGGDLQSLRDPLVGPVVGTGDVGLEKYASVEQLAGVRPAAAHERFESPALLFGEAHDVLLVDGDHPLSSPSLPRVLALFEPCNQTVAEY